MFILYTFYKMWQYVFVTQKFKLFVLINLKSLWYELVHMHYEI